MSSSWEVIDSYLCDLDYQLLEEQNDCETEEERLQKEARGLEHEMFLVRTRRQAIAKERRDLHQFRCEIRQHVEDGDS